MNLNLIRGRDKFFDQFSKQAELIATATELLLRECRNPEPNSPIASLIGTLEHEGDHVTHDVFMRLHKSFLTPLDPEDIHALASALDDVLDGTEDCAHRLASYRIEEVPGALQQMCAILVACASSIKEALSALPLAAGVQLHCIEINRLENEADQVVRAEVARLFEVEKDPVRLMIIKEILDFLERTIDRCEDVADILQNILLKNA